MSKEVLILTGTCGVGKTTTAQVWSALKRGVVIECDSFREWLDPNDFPKWSDKEEKFIANMAAMMSMEYLRLGLPVAIDNVWTPSAIELIRNELFRISESKVTSLFLTCDKEENHNRDKQRIPKNQMNERVDIVSEELNSYKWPNYVHKLDTTNLSIQQVIDEVVKM